MSAPLAQLPDDELRGVVLAAEACLRLESARLYGFIAGGPDVDVSRCEEAIAYGRERGIEATDDEIDQAIAGLTLELAHRPTPQGGT